MALYEDNFMALYNSDDLKKWDYQEQDQRLL